MRLHRGLLNIFMPYDSSAAIMLTPLQEYRLLCRGAQDRYGEIGYHTTAKVKRKPEWCPVDQCWIDPEPLPEDAEHHHIVLKRHGGTNKASNMAWMSCLNHILAHWLLFKATDRHDPHWFGVMHACRMMLNVRSIEDLEALDIGALEKQAELRTLNNQSRKFVGPAGASGYFIPGSEPEGWKQSAFSKENKAESDRKRVAERYATPEYRKKQREYNAKRYSTPEYRKKQRERDAERRATPEAKKKQREYNAKRNATPEAKKKIKERNAEYYATPEGRKKAKERNAKRKALPFGREIKSKVDMRSKAKKVGNQARFDMLDREIAELRARQKEALAQQ